MARCLRGTVTGRRMQQLLWCPVGSRAISLGVASLEPPRFADVPVVREEPAAILADMPELTLSGPSAVRRSEMREGQISRSTLDQPLSAELAPADAPVESSEGTQPPEVRFAKLANGVRVAAVDRHGLCASLGLFVHAGSRYESAGTCSIPHALELMAFKSSAHLSHIRTLKTLEQLGAAASCRVGREDLLYQVDVLRDYVPVMLPLMLANVLCPSLLPEEVAAAQEYVFEVQQSLEENTEGLLSELLHSTAYKGNTIGHPLYAEEKDLPLFTAENLRTFLQKKCTPDRLIVMGVNVNFDELCKWTVRSFAEYEGSWSSPAPVCQDPAPAVYTGGEIRVDKPNPLCHLMLGWEVKGGWNGPSLAAITVLQMFLGGGGSFSTGGPGKGMHTRLYTDVLNRHHWVESCQASSAMYADSGLFTIYATVLPQFAGDFVTVLQRIFTGLSRITPDELQRAKNALKSSIHMNLEMRAIMMEDIGRQLVLSGKVGTAQEFGRMADAVTADDLRMALKECLKSNLTVVAYGAIDGVPKSAIIEQRLKACL